MTLYVLGDSHVVALGQALEALRQEGTAPDIRIGKLFSFPLALKRFFNVADDGITFRSPNMAAKFEALTGSRGFDASSAPDMFVLSMAFTTTILVRHPMWNEYTLASLPLRNRQAISKSAMRALVLDHFQHILELFRVLADFGIRCAALGAPPPRDDDPHLAGRRRFRRLILAVDRVAREHVSAALGELNIPVIAPPLEAYAGSPGESFLSDAFKNSRDFHHANTEYGRLMLGRVMAEFSGA